MAFIRRGMLRARLVARPRTEGGYAVRRDRPRGAHSLKRRHAATLSTNVGVGPQVQAPRSRGVGTQY